MNTEQEPEDELRIRTMTPGEPEIAILWAEREGWNPGIHDAETLYIDPGGWYIAEINGRPVATVVMTNYDENFAFAGFYIVSPSCRGTGTGSRISMTAMEHAGTRNVGIDGVFEMQDKYRDRSGFLNAYRNIRYEGLARGEQQQNLIQARDVSLSEISEYDSLHFPAHRPEFLRRWLEQEDSTALVAPDHSGGIGGYGVIRQCFSGHKIGPLFADSPRTAESLLQGLTSGIRGGTFSIDMPEPNREALRMAERHSLSQVFGTARMYTQELPSLPTENIFGVTTFELG